MEVSRPDRQRGFSLTMKVGLLLALSYSFTNMAWNYVDEEYLYKKGQSSYYLVLTVICAFGNVMGAMLADHLSKRL